MLYIMLTLFICNNFTKIWIKIFWFDFIIDIKFIQIEWEKLFVLQIVQLYEKRGVSLAEWRPLLWGEAAASFYSVLSQITPGLWNKQNFHQLMDLFDEHRVHLTIANFPVDRNLWVSCLTLTSLFNDLLVVSCFFFVFFLHTVKNIQLTHTV